MQCRQNAWLTTRFGFFAVNLDINLGGHFLLTDAFKKTTSQNGLIEVGMLKKPASINTD